MPKTFACKHRNEKTCVERIGICVNCGRKIEWRQIIRVGGRTRNGEGEWNHTRTLSTQCEPTVATPGGCYHERERA